MSDKYSWPCWSCKKPVTMSQRADSDGDCPHCGAELDIESWPFPSGVASVVGSQEPVAYDLSKAEYFEGVAELRQQSLTRAWGKIRQLRTENEQLKAKLAHQEVEAGTLAERMKAAGMMTVDELLAGAPLDAFHRHAGVNSLETFGQWLEMRRREYVTMHAKRTLDKREDDDLYEWVLAHSGVFGEVHINFKAAMAGHEKNG